MEVVVRFVPALCAVLFVFSLAVVPRAAARAKETGFLDRRIRLHGKDYKYQVFVPEDWSPKRRWPVILFLHGAGERGADGLVQTEPGLPRAIRLDRSRFPTIVVMPQCPREVWWPAPEMEEMALDALDAATAEFKGVKTHTYLTGLSMGGYGTWDLASRHPGKFAAIVPICGGIVAPPGLVKIHPELAKTAYPDDPKSYAQVANNIGKTPVWIFHGADDPTVPVDSSRKLAKALKAAGGDVRYTEYPETGHNSWDKAYAEPELMPWLLSKSL
jgi:predicted peptidase